MGRCSAGAAECATTKTSNPTTADVAVCRPNDRVDVEVRRRGGSRLSFLLTPLTAPVLLIPVSVSVHLVAVFRRTLRAALESTVGHAARSSARKPTSSGSSSLRERNSGRNTTRSDMKYSPQQQQKQRKSESDTASVDATLSRTSASVAQEQRKSSSTSSSTRPAVCRSPSTGMFAWMRVFRLASMLHQVGC